jgi:hypothetical protein
LLTQWYSSNPVCLCVLKALLKKINFFLFFLFSSNLYVLVFLDYFDALISKMIFKKIKKHYFNIFLSKKHFKKQPQPHSQTGGKIPFRLKPKERKRKQRYLYTSWYKFEEENVTMHV